MKKIHHSIIQHFIDKIFFKEKAKKDFWIIKKALLLQSVWSSSLRNLIY